MSKGFTVTEVLITLFLFVSIISLPMVFLWGFGRSDTVIATAKEIVSVIHEAQTDTISGKSSDGDEPTSYGIHFETSYYVYFQGASYNPSATTNQRTDLSPGISFSQINLPSQNVIFSRPSGEVAGFDPSLNFVEVQDANTSITKRITISRFGAIGYE